MENTTRLGLTLYETSDKFQITGDEDSLNHDMEIIDEAVVVYDMTVSELKALGGDES